VGGALLVVRAVDEADGPSAMICASVPKDS
jgi:hypothetical protein